ncbi:MAG: helix-turn-helix domain-containing protein [Erysipelotrichales bacterium]|nr:helix-turn-helix domain-containing protein [Erysipelotrichales bacterium]
MNFGIKLQQLRKEKGLSQEALAEKLNVSRQAVSKWETGDGYPEMDKIILISDLFQVSIDYLMRDNQEHHVEDATQKYFMNKQRIEDYMKFKKQFGIRIALGVSSIVFSLNLPIYLSDTRYEMLGTAGFLLVVGFAVMIFIITGISTESYSELEHKEINMSYNDLQDLQNKYMKFKSKFGMLIALGVFIIIASLVGVVLITQYLPNEKLAGILFMTCVSISLVIFIYQGICDGMYKFLTQNKKYINEQGKQEKKGDLYAVTMPLAAMVYLIMGLTMNWWHPGWIVFPITVFLTEGIQYFMNKE